MGFREVTVRLASLLVLSLVSVAMAAEPGAAPTAFASAQQVEAGFRGQSFTLGSDTKVAVVRALNWDKDRFVNIEFWLGTGNVVPPASRPKRSGYYVISEAYIVRSLGGNEWLIRAGSSLQKPDAVFITGKTHYKTTGVILPTIVQYIEDRTFTRTDGSKINVPVLHEVSLPMKWTSGTVPSMYARFQVRQ